MTDLVNFENKKVRRIEYNGEWYFSVVDMVALLTDSSVAKRYWTDLKRKLKDDEGFIEVYEKIVRLKLTAEDGKLRATDCANTETIFRIIQSIPSPKAEPIKQWLARVGYERIKETADPELSINRARENWQKLGYPDKWIQLRMMGQETRNKLTDYWKNHEVTLEKEYAILTNTIHQAWAGLTVKEHKDLKGLKKENLRDHMSEEELHFTSLAELTTRRIAENTNATGMTENEKAARRGGSVAKFAKEKFEEETGQKVITSNNHLSLNKQTKQTKQIELEKDIE